MTSNRTVFPPAHPKYPNRQIPVISETLRIILILLEVVVRNAIMILSNIFAELLTTQIILNGEILP